MPSQAIAISVVKPESIKAKISRFFPWSVLTVGLFALPQAASAQLSNSILTALNSRLPNAAASSGTSMNTLVQFMLWVLAVVLVSLCAFGVVEGINGRGWNKAFAAVVGSVSIAILVAVVLQATS